MAMAGVYPRPVTGPSRTAGNDGRPARRRRRRRGLTTTVYLLHPEGAVEIVFHRQGDYFSGRAEEPQTRADAPRPVPSEPCPTSRRGRGLGQGARVRYRTGSARGIRFRIARGGVRLARRWTVGVASSAPTACWSRTASSTTDAGAPAAARSRPFMPRFVVTGIVCVSIPRWRRSASPRLPGSGVTASPVRPASRRTCRAWRR